MLGKIGARVSKPWKGCCSRCFCCAPRQSRRRTTGWIVTAVMLSHEPLGHAGTNTTPHTWLGGWSVRSESNDLYFRLSCYLALMG